MENEFNIVPFETINFACIKSTVDRSAFYAGRINVEDDDEARNKWACYLFHPIDWLIVWMLINNYCNILYKC